MERILARRELLLAIWAVVLLVVPIEAQQPSGTCYSDADALNADLVAFAETERDSNIFLDNDSVAFEICPGTVWDVSNVALYVINLREEFPIILSCGDFYSTAVVDERQEQEAPVCVLTGTGTVDGSQVTVKGSVRFVGLTFTEFSGSAIGIPGQWEHIPSRVEFSHCRFESFDSIAIVQSDLPIDLRVFNTNIRNGRTTETAFQGSGGTWSFQFVAVQSFESSELLLASHDSSVVFIRHVYVIVSDIANIFVANGGATMDATNVRVQNMIAVATIFSIQGQGSSLTLQNLFVDNNVHIDSMWSVVSIRESAVASVAQVTLERHVNLQYAFQAADAAKLDIVQANVARMESGLLLDPLAINAIVAASGGSDVKVSELNADYVSSFTTIFIAVSGSTMDVDNSCVLHGSGQAAVFASEDSTILSNSNYINNDGFPSSVCGESESRLAKEDPESGCFQANQTECTFTCLGFFDASSCAASLPELVPIVPPHDPLAIPIIESGSQPETVVTNFYIAFVVPGLSADPTLDAYEMLRLGTMTFFLENLSSTDSFSQYYTGFSHLDLSVLNTWLCTDIPRDNFDLLIQFTAELFFEPESPIPDSGVAFESLQSTISADYIRHTAQGVTGLESTNEVILQPGTMPTPAYGDDTTCFPDASPGPPDAPVSEPETNLIPISTEFYMALAVSRLSADPMPDTYEQLQNVTTTFFAEELPKESSFSPYTGFSHLDLLVVDVWLCTGIPDDQYNLLFHFSGTLFFQPGSPFPTDHVLVFRSLQSTISVDYIRDFVWSVSELGSTTEIILRSIESMSIEIPESGGSTCFPTTSPLSMSIAPTISMTPSAVPSTSMVPSSSMAPSRQSSGFPSQEPSSSMTPSAVPSTSMAPSLSVAPSPESSNILDSLVYPPSMMEVSNGFYMAFVVTELSEEPSTDVDEELRQSTVDFFNQTLTELSFVGGQEFGIFRGFDLAIGSSEFGSGKPAERFNYYIEFCSRSFFDVNGPSPDPETLFDILQQSVSSHFVQEYIWGIDELRSTQEAVIRKVADQLFLAYCSYGGTVPPPLPMNSSQPGLLSMPGDDLSLAALDDATTVPVDFRLGFVFQDGANGTLRPELYERVRQSTILFFDKTLTEFYLANPDVEFLDFELSVAATDCESELPDRFSSCIEFSSTTFFDAEGASPDSEKLLETLRESITDEFLRDYIWGLVGGDFASTVEVALRNVVQDTVSPSATPTMSAAPTASSPPSSAPSQAPSRSFEPSQVPTKEPPAVESKESPTPAPNVSGDDPTTGGNDNPATSASRCALQGDVLMGFSVALVAFLFF